MDKKVLDRTLINLDINLVHRGKGVHWAHLGSFRVKKVKSASFCIKNFPKHAQCTPLTW